MKPWPGTVHGGGDPFAPTRWTVVFAAAHADGQPGEADAALAELCRTYWTPLYIYVRGRSHSPHDAQDLTQGFFAHLIEHRIYDRADPSKGKFRSFLLAAIKNFLANARDHDRRLKRGGTQDPLPLLEEAAREAETFYQTQIPAPGPATGADRSFERSWAYAVTAAAMARVAQDYLAEGKRGLFDALRPFIAGNADALPAHERVAAALGMPASTVRSHVTRLRARYREALRAEVRRTVDAESDVREELATLLRVLTDR